MNKVKYIKNIIAEINNKYKTNQKKKLIELDKITKFVKNSEYFNGKKREIYKIIVKAKK